MIKVIYLRLIDKNTTFIDQKQLKVYISFMASC